MRKFLTVGLSAGLLATSLTGCSAVSGLWGGTECTPTPDGPATSLVTFADNGTATPQLDFPTPIKVPSVQTHIVSLGEGEPLAYNKLVKIRYVGYQGSTGEQVLAQGYAENPSPLSVQIDENALPILSEALNCLPQGTQAIVVAPLADVSTSSPEDLGMPEDEVIVFYFNIARVYPLKANGADQWITTAGLPSVSVAPNGQPGLTIPRSEPPSTLIMATTKRGSGPLVKLDDSVTVHYTGWLWSDGSIFDSTWTLTKPTTFSLGDGSLIPGFVSAVVGQTEGSQVIVVVPPDQGYGNQANGSIPAGSTLIFVIDILGID